MGVDPLEVTAAPAASAPASVEETLEERLEAPLYLLRNYEQTLANWFLMAGYDVNYNLWGL